MATDPTDEAYEALLDLASVDDQGVRRLLSLFVEGADPDALAQRWEDEHVYNPAGRREARVHEAEPGVWEADPLVGLQGARTFPTREAAERWVRRGAHYETPLGPG